ncbi:MAG: tRNA-specific adenosine deaminase subunit tad3 [Vezdaea aestivalis]|nr:MAG: tRNA-specific adenosine deaminase subunit tad3 [Vezdaea aestivalis]
MATTEFAQLSLGLDMMDDSDTNWETCSGSETEDDSSRYYSLDDDSPRYYSFDESSDDMAGRIRRKRPPPAASKEGSKPPRRVPSPPRRTSPHLEPVKTFKEVHEIDRIAEAYAVKIPPASGALIARLMQNKNGTPEQRLIRQIREATHLRRFVRRNQLPDYVRNTVTPEEIEVGQRPNNDIGRLYFLACLTSTIPASDLCVVLEPFIKPTWPDEDIQIRRVLVNLSPPLTEEASSRDTRKYWPSTFKKNNPFGPQASALATAKVEMQPVTSRYMNLANTVALEGKALGLGAAVGAVITTRDHKIVAVACDTRYAPLATPNPTPGSDTGNPMCHAVLRAISMVARQRRKLDPLRPNVRQGETEETFCDKPMTATEQMSSTESVLEPSGYLCLHLDIYLTHEPCVMCSMALLHSRFTRVVIGKRVRSTGGLFADRQKGYGLGWRDELNWRFITFQWHPETTTLRTGRSRRGRAVVKPERGGEIEVSKTFHA